MQDRNRAAFKVQRDQISWARIADLVYSLKIQDKVVHHEAFNHERNQLRIQVPRIKILLGEQKCPDMSFQTIAQIKRFIKSAITFASLVIQSNTFDLDQSAIILQIAIESVQMITKYVDHSYMQRTVKELDRLKRLLNENVRLYLIQKDKDEKSLRKLQDSKKEEIQLEKCQVYTEDFEEEQNNDFLFSTIKNNNAEQIIQDELFEDISMLKTCVDSVVQYLTIEQLEEIIEEIKASIANLTNEYMKCNVSTNQEDDIYNQFCIQDPKSNAAKAPQDDFDFDELSYQLQKQYQRLEYNYLHINALKYLQKHSITYDQLYANQISSNLITFDTTCIQDNNFKKMLEQILNQRFYILGTNKFDNYFVLFLVKLFGKSFKIVQTETILMNIMYQLLHHKQISDFFVAFVVDELFNQKIVYEDFSFKQYLPQFKQCFTVNKSTIAQFTS